MQATQAIQSRAKFSDSVLVGKDILELLSSAMYVDPLSIFREYVQNAADSIDEAIELGLFHKGSQPQIYIELDPLGRSVIIGDTGAGVPQASFKRILTSIGGSRKRGTNARGFRGVGRLAGLGYCQNLIMRSRSVNDSVVLCMHWDCKRLKEVLRDPADTSLDEIVREIVEIYTEPATGSPSHFFEIEMQGVVRSKNDVLLNSEAVERYLSQVAPVPFHPEFSFGKQIAELLRNYNAYKTYPLTINSTPVFRPYRDTYEARQNVHGSFLDVDFFTVPGLNEGIDAVGWILHSDYLGAIPERHGIEGLRLRAGNVQIGDARILDTNFPEPRFNAWTVGECHITSAKLIPNARRDNFEENPHYENLLGNLIPKAKQIAKTCRERSAERARLRGCQTTSAQDNGVNWNKAKEFFISQADKPITQTQRAQLRQRILKKTLPNYGDLLRLLVSAENLSEQKE